MPEAYFSLSAADQREVIDLAAGQSQRPGNLLEKDIYVVWALDALFKSRIGDDLVFKGGTSLSKVYGVIDRFSEDVDLTYDIRAIAQDIVADNVEALPTTRSEEKRWSKEVRKRLPNWVQETALPIVQTAFAADAWSAPIEVVRPLVWLLSLEDGRDGKAPEARGDRREATSGGRSDFTGP
ncbi:nucleotidyl transferase AbiEii/AbiGii toxin family protein, partial [Methylobacterium sp. J-001]|uniref:nucleotidyl transferase AbiEii/AbiGii toxin family protein n=1 Tax=Methylobacterium sp. J-001 TaxID=2836609 RepID=UPI001FB98C5F